MKRNQGEIAPSHEVELVAPTYIQPKTAEPTAIPKLKNTGQLVIECTLNTHVNRLQRKAYALNLPQDFLTEAPGCPLTQQIQVI